MHDAIHDAGDAAHSGADDRDLRAVRPNAQRHVEAREFAPDRFELVAVDDEEDARVVHVDHVDGDVALRGAAEEFEFQLAPRFEIVDLTLDHADEHDVA